MTIAVVVGGVIVGAVVGVGVLIAVMELSDGRTEYGWLI